MSKGIIREMARVEGGLKLLSVGGPSEVLPPPPPLMPPPLWRSLVDIFLRLPFSYFGQCRVNCLLLLIGSSQTWFLVALLRFFFAPLCAFLVCFCVLAFSLLFCTLIFFVRFSVSDRFQNNRAWKFQTQAKRSKCSERSWGQTPALS